MGPTHDGAVAGLCAAMAVRRVSFVRSERRRGLGAGTLAMEQRLTQPYEYRQKRVAPGDRPSCDGASAPETEEEKFSPSLLLSWWKMEVGVDRYLREEMVGQWLERRYPEGAPLAPSRSLHLARHRFHVPRSAPLCRSLIFFAVAAAPGFSDFPLWRFPHANESSPGTYL